MTATTPSTGLVPARRHFTLSEMLALAGYAGASRQAQH
jgi:hypothetical protein